MQRLKERLRARRNALGLSQLELAEKSGVAERTIAGFESKGGPASMRIVDKLAGALAVSSTWLLGGDEPQFLKDSTKRQSPGPSSPYSWMETSTVEKTIIDLVGRLRKCAPNDRKHIIGNLAEAVNELETRELSPPPHKVPDPSLKSPSESQRIAEQASASDDAEHHHEA